MFTSNTCCKTLFEHEVNDHLEVWGRAGYCSKVFDIVTDSDSDNLTSILKKILIKNHKNSG